MSADATVYQGTDNVLALVIYQSTAETTPKDLTSFTVVGYRLGYSQSDTTLLEVTASVNANGSVVAFGTRANGEVDITLGRADLAALRAMRYSHQLVLADGSGSQQVVMDGHITVKEALPAA